MPTAKELFPFGVPGQTVVAEPTFSGRRFHADRRDLQELVSAVSARSRSSESRGAIGYRLTSTGQRQPIHGPSAITYLKRSHFFAPGIRWQVGRTRGSNFEPHHSHFNRPLRSFQQFCQRPKNRTKSLQSQFGQNHDNNSACNT